MTTQTKTKAKKAPDAIKVAHPVPAVRQRQSESLMAVIERASTDSGVDVAKMQELYSMLKEMRADEAKANFAADWVDMKPALPLVIRTKRNQQTNSNYAPQEDINKEIDPILSKFGFGSAGTLIGQTADSVTVQVEIWHRDGHVKSMPITMPIDDKGMAGKTNKTVLHGISSAISYCKRVGTCLLLNISTGDDKDGNTPKAKKEADPFAKRVEQEAKNGGPIIDQDPEQNQRDYEAELKGEADKLAKHLSKLDKEKRGAVLLKNKPLLQQLDEAGMTAVIEALHALANEETTNAA